MLWPCPIYSNCAYPYLHTPTYISKNTDRPLDPRNHNPTTPPIKRKSPVMCCPSCLLSILTQNYKERKNPLHFALSRFSYFLRVIYLIPYDAFVKYLIIPHLEPNYNPVVEISSTRQSRKLPIFNNPPIEWQCFPEYACIIIRHLSPFHIHPTITIKSDSVVVNHLHEKLPCTSLVS